MNMQKFIKLCKESIVAWSDGSEVSVKNVFTVWSCKTLQNAKVLLATDVAGDERYFEFTYNGDKREIYMDTYEHVSNKVISLNKNLNDK